MTNALRRPEMIYTPSAEAACDYIADMLEGLRDIAVSAGLQDLAGVLELAGVAADRARRGE